MIKIIQNRNFILILAIVLGLLFSELASSVQRLTLPALMIIMTAASISINPKDLLTCGKVVQYVISSFFIHYILLGGLITVLAWWLVPRMDLWVGYVLIAAAPPGVAILPFTNIVKGNINLSFIGTFVLYLASLFMMPLMILVLTGSTAVPLIRVFTVMLQLVIFPIFLSQMIKRSRVASKIEMWKGKIINWGFFTIVFTVVGLNKDVFVSQPNVLFRVFLVIFLSTSIMVILVRCLGRYLKIAEEETRSYMLLGSLKNAGLAAGIALNFYNEATSVPGAVVSVFYAMYFIYLGNYASKD